MKKAEVLFSQVNAALSLMPAREMREVVTHIARAVAELEQALREPIGKNLERSTSSHARLHKAPRKRVRLSATSVRHERILMKRLGRKDLSEADLISCIELLEVLLSTESVPTLQKVAGDPSSSKAVRRRAREALKMLRPLYDNEQVKPGKPPRGLRVGKMRRASS